MADKLFAVTIGSLLVAIALTGCATRTSYIDLYGMPADPRMAIRTIDISPTTKYVNVEGGEIIRFVSGNQEFGWHFLVAWTVSSFSLNEVAPPGALDHPVHAYVSPDPRYIGAPDE